MSSKQAGIFIILLFCLSCSSNIEKEQYIVSKRGDNLVPYAKVTYRINANTGTIFYWTEKPGLKRSQPLELKNCKVEDLNNWEGVAENILLWKVKVKFDHGRFESLGTGLENVDWFTWTFRTASNPASLLKFADTGLPVWGVIVMLGISTLIIVAWRGLKWSKKGYRKPAGQRQLLGKARTKPTTSFPPPKKFHERNKFIEPWQATVIPALKIGEQKKEPSVVQKFSGEAIKTKIQEKVLAPEEAVITREDILGAKEKLSNTHDQLRSDPKIDLQAMLENLEEKGGKFPDQ